MPCSAWWPGRLGRQVQHRLEPFARAPLHDADRHGTGLVPNLLQLPVFFLEGLQSIPRSLTQQPLLTAQNAHGALWTVQFAVVADHVSSCSSSMWSMLTPLPSLMPATQGGPGRHGHLARQGTFADGFAMTPWLGLAQQLQCVDGDWWRSRWCSSAMLRRKCSAYR
jgi:hypothetical protein